MATKTRQPSRTLSSGDSSSESELKFYSNFWHNLYSILSLLLLIYLLFWKIILNDMIFSTSADSASHEAWTHAISQIKQHEGIDALWVPYVFSGMPAIASLLFPHNVNYIQSALNLVGQILFLGSDVSFYLLHFFLMGVFTYLLARQLQLPPVPSLLAAIIMTLHPESIGLAQSAHGSKLITLSYIPLLLLLTIRLFRRRTLLDFALLAITTGTMFLARHPQMAFYGLLAVGAYAIYEIVLHVKREPSSVIKSLVLFTLALGIGFAIYTYEFLPTQEYSRYSIRGGTGEPGAGLTYDYATSWSLHPFELSTYIIPSSLGFSSGYVTDWQGQRMPMPLYWGWMPFTDSPLYAGIVAVFLAIVAITYRRDAFTWFLLILATFIILIAFGRHFSLVYDLFFNYFPYFNKFRVPSMILYLIPLLLGLLAARGLAFLLELKPKGKDGTAETVRLRMLKVLYFLGGLALLVLIGKGVLQDFLSGFMFTKEGDIQQYGQQVATIFKEKRFEIFWSDLLRIVILMGSVAGLAVMYLRQSIREMMLGIGVVIVAVIDLAILDVKFIDPKPKTAMQEQFLPDATIQFLKTDASPYRIFPLGELFGDNAYMYHTVGSIGGYSPAKLKIYQEMIDSLLYKGSDPQFPLNMNVINMLNAKYLLAKGRLPERPDLTLVNVNQQGGTLTYLNGGHLPRAWFVDSFVVAQNKSQVFSMMNDPSWNARTTAILEKEVSGSINRSDSTSARVMETGAHSLKAQTYSEKISLLVLSEIYYPAGWKAFVDGEETEIYKTNYILRSVVVPAGAHEVELRFAPESIQMGATITNIAWGISALLLVAGLYMEPSIRRKLGMKMKDRSPGEKPEPEKVKL